MTSTAIPAQAAAVEAARRSYGRLLAWLAWQWRDIAAAEDALADAFASALQTWPQRGVPASPEGWLLAVAKNNLQRAARRQRLAEDPALTLLWPDASTPAAEATAVPDDRLRLMFVCSHPAIDPDIRTALMLQVVLGIDAARIAPAFLLTPQAMQKRLVRAKAKISASRIRFEEPGRDELAGRLHAVLEAIDAGYTLDTGAAVQPGAGPLTDEALFLARLVAVQLPGEAEALGLLALLSFCEARKPARLDEHGEFVALDLQDTGRWNHALMAEADALLAPAAGLQCSGPLQLEAAIQAAHCDRAFSGTVPWAAIVALYQRLLDMAATTGARIGHAVATAQALGDARAGVRLLQAIEPASVAAHQPWWASSAHLQAAAGNAAEAVQAFDRALALTIDPVLRRHLGRRRAEARSQLR